MSGIRGRGRPSTSPLEVTHSRSLTHGDIELLRANPSALGSKVPDPVALRHAHHNMAMLLAQGRPNVEVALITGYSTGRITQLREAPAFQELEAHYRSQREGVFLDVLERLKTLGISTLDELQAQLEENPKGWSKRELMELAELTLVKGRAGIAGAAGGGIGAAGGAPGVTINVKFVEPSGAGGPVIDGKIS